jgi:hypothetical protein
MLTREPPRLITEGARLRHALTCDAMSGHRPWREIKHKRDGSPEPMQKTPKGYEIPVPKRSDLFGAMKKIARPGNT